MSAHPRMASLPMYDFPEIRAHTNDLWAGMAHELIAVGIDDVPSALTRPDGPLVVHWRDNSLLLSQTCGYPVVRQLPDIHVLGSFAVVSGAERPGHYRSVLVARRSDSRSLHGVAGFSGARAAANDDGSLSGWVSLGWAFAEAGASPGPVTFTGQHALSVVAVRDGHADIASIDSHSYSLFARHRPESVEGLVVVGHGPEVAVTPLFTAHTELVEPIRSAVARALNSASPKVLSELMITGWVSHGREDHDHVVQLAERALAVLST